MHYEAVKTICDLEHRIDTQALVYGGVNYWPLCRLRLWSSLIASSLKSAGAGSDPVSNTGPSFQASGRTVVRPVGNAGSGLVSIDAVEDTLTAEEGMLAPDIMFFVRPEEYRDEVEGASFAKMIDSVYDRAHTYNRLKIELANPGTMAFRRRNPSLFLHAELAAQAATFDPPHELESVSALETAVYEAGLDVELSAQSLAEDMGKIFYWARLFEPLLTEVTPKAIMLSVYYHPVGMALMLAAHRLGIATSDIQHGRLGPHNGVYTQLTAAPEEGYALMPDFVWCWGSQTKHDIEVDKAAACNRHDGIVGGNPWLDRWLSGAQRSDETATLIEESAGKRCVLVSLQQWETPIPSFMLEAMARAPEQWTWWLRVHPLRRHTISEIRDLLSRHDIANFEIERSTQLPLFALLRACDHHVTFFSSVAVEAMAFGKSTTLLTDTGRAIFAPYIDAGIFRVANTAQEVIDAVTAALASEAVDQLERPFIDTRPNLAEAALATLLDSRDHGSHE